MRGKDKVAKGGAFPARPRLALRIKGVGGLVQQDDTQE